jgi:hypothetical protein
MPLALVTEWPQYLEMDWVRLAGGLDADAAGAGWPACARFGTVDACGIPISWVGALERLGAGDGSAGDDPVTFRPHLREFTKQT